MGFFVFSTDTTVQTPDGDVPISEIEIGDTVIAYDEETGETGEYTVTDTISHEDDQIAYVTIDGEEIETTPWHLFYTSEGWVEAGDLQEGDTVVSLSDYGTVDSVIIVDATQIMYDLTVEEVHTFAVGDGDWVVHNCNVQIGDLDINLDGNINHLLQPRKTDWWNALTGNDVSPSEINTLAPDVQSKLAEIMTDPATNMRAIPIQGGRTRYEFEAVINENIQIQIRVGIDLVVNSVRFSPNGDFSNRYEYDG